MERIEHFKEKLEAELAILTKELESVGRINPDNAADWEAVPAQMNVLQADANERADEIEEYENNIGITNNLEVRFNEVKAALKRIEDGTYGVCEISGEPIEEDRLEANPAATTCKQHLNEAV